MTEGGEEQFTRTFLNTFCVPSGFNWRGLQCVCAMHCRDEDTVGIGGTARVGKGTM